MAEKSLAGLLTEGKPVLVYDAACAFCRQWVARVQRRAGDVIKYLSIGEAAQRISPEQCAACAQAIHLFMPDGSVYRGAHAVLKVWSLSGQRHWLLWVYENIPGVKIVAEAVYRFIATHRMQLPGS